VLLERNAAITFSEITEVIASGADEEEDEEVDERLS